MILYHYTRPNLWKHISQGTGSEGYRGLVPRSSYLNTVGAPLSVFALTEPTPASWRLNSDYPDAWSDLVSLDIGIGQMLLEITVDSSDNISVHDYGHRLFGFMYACSDEARAKGDLEYLNTGLALPDYLQKLRDGEDFSLPEVLIHNPIPLERLRVSAAQPLIDQVIDGNAPFRYRIGEQQEDRKVLLEEIQGVAELALWAQRCQEAMQRPPMFVRKER